MMNDPVFIEGLESIDQVFCGLMQRLAPTDDPWIKAAVALLSRVSGEGHVCLDLDLAGRQIREAGLQHLIEDGAPASGVWRRRLLEYPPVGAPGTFKPMILDGPRLYLHRYWHHENTLATALLQRCRTFCPEPNREALEKILNIYFADEDADQQEAGLMAATRTLAVISGGPGTGKTHTLARIILMLQDLSPAKPLRVKLAAPTGKAAARMQESIKAALDRLRPSGEASQTMVPEAQTLHRMLGAVPGLGRFRYHADHLLSADVVIVDEASMIDLALMAHLMRAIPDQARLIITGDKDQLASVEAGAVLGDICYGLGGVTSGQGDRSDYVDGFETNTAPPSPLSNHIIVLRKNYRFSAASGLGALSRAINSGDHEEAVQLLAPGHNNGLGLKPVPGAAALSDALIGEVVSAYGPLMGRNDPREALEQLSRLKILTVVRQGPFGVQAINRTVERILHSQGLIRTMPRPSGWYAGRPVLITRNDYFHNLFNGDMGIALGSAEEEDRQMLRVVFADQRGGYRHLTPFQVPSHETVYAMTVHKSQGSEFERVILILPDQDVPILTRELLYTAVTRARSSLLILGHPDLLRLALERRVVRASGLRLALWPDAERV